MPKQVFQSQTSKAKVQENFFDQGSKYLANNIELQRFYSLACLGVTISMAI